MGGKIMFLNRVVRIVAFFVALFCTACAATTKESKLDTELNIGWLHGSCLAIKNPNIKSETEFMVFSLGNENEKIKASIINSAESGDDCFALLDDRKSVNVDQGYSFYKVESPKEIDFAIGVLVSAENHNLSFSQCTTSEGISFSAFNKKLKIWEGYYYLGYESKATC